LFFLLGVGIAELLPNLRTKVCNGGVDFGAEATNGSLSSIRHINLQAATADDAPEKSLRQNRHIVKPHV